MSMQTQQAMQDRVKVGDKAQIGEVYTGGKRQVNTAGGMYVEGDAYFYASPAPTTPLRAAPGENAAHVRPNVPTSVVNDLVEYVAQGRLALFVGGDVPQSVTGVPSRADLARGLAVRKGLDESLTLAGVTQRVMKQAHQRWEFTHYVKNQLSTYDKTPQRFHQLLVQLPVQMTITYKRQELLKRAFAQGGIPINHLVKDSDVPFSHPRQRTLLRLYGELSQPESLIVTEDDHYGLWRNRDKESLLDEIRTTLRRHVILFVGHNLASPDFNLLWRDVQDRMGRFAIGAYAVWPNLPENEQQMWQNRQITIIDAEPLPFLEALVAEVGAAR